MKFELKPYTIHELGQRQNQEDSLYPEHGKATANDRIFVLCDGMGGHEKGEVASATVCETISNSLRSRWFATEPLSDALLLKAIEDAYDALDAKDGGEVKKMGTTMTFICFHASGATVAHIGDSRVYHLRPAKGKEPARIMYKTRDHSLVNDLVKIGEITEEEAKNHPQKNVITRAMQPGMERRSKADIAHIVDIKEGDYFYMCSDGMLEVTDDVELLKLITNPNKTNEEKVEQLCEKTVNNKDNHTAHLIYVDNVLGIPATKVPDAVTPMDETVLYPVNSPKSSIKIPRMAYVAVAAIVLISLIVWMCSGSKSNNNNGPVVEDTLNNIETIVVPEEVSPSPGMDPAKADSIARAHRLDSIRRQHRLDSIRQVRRQDSIARVRREDSIRQVRMKEAEPVKETPAEVTTPAATEQNGAEQ